MEKQKKKKTWSKTIMYKATGDISQISKNSKNMQTGITLIALVISIIVMLILAGVSLNMTVGENGIITKAQDAAIQSGMAVLEEFLQQKYVEKYWELENSEGEYTELEFLTKAYPEYFYFNGTKDYVLKNVSYTDEEGNERNEYIKLRLIRKNQLPKEISRSLKSGDAIGTSGNSDSQDAYEQLIDCYGVNSDLKVFYCFNGLETAIGADYLSSDLFDGTKVLYSANSTLSKAISSTLGIDAKDLTVKDLYGITELTIRPDSGMTDLTTLGELPNLTKLTLYNYVGSLKGIERAYQLTELYFNNSGLTQKIDYTGLSGATKLQKLWFFYPTNDELKGMCEEMAKADYNYLDEMWLTCFWSEWWKDFKTDGNGYNDASETCEFNNISYLSKLTTLTKQKLTKITISGTKVQDISALSSFSNITNARLSGNNISNISSLASMSKLSWLDLSGNKSLTDLGSLKNLTKLSTIFIRKCSGLTDLSGILVKSSPIYINGTSDTSLDFSTTVWTEKNKALLTKLGNVAELYLPSKYSLLFLDKSYITLSTENTWDEVKVLKNKTTLNSINFNENQNLTDDNIQELLKALPNVYNVNLDNTNVKNLDWATGKTNLQRVSFKGTLVTDITPMYSSTELGLIRFDASKATVILYKDDTSSTLTAEEKSENTVYNNKIITMIERTYDYLKIEGDTVAITGRAGGFNCLNLNYFQQINKLTGLTKFAYRLYDSPDYGFDFSNTSLKNINMQMWNSYTVTVPSTIETIYSLYGTYFKADSIVNLKSLSGNGTAFVKCNNISTTFNDSQNGVTVRFSGDVPVSIENYSGWFGNWVGSFSYAKAAAGVYHGTFSSDIVKDMTRCTSISINCASCSKLDGESFANYTRDFSFALCRTNVQEFTNVNSVTHLTSLDLSYNKIVDVAFFVDNIEKSNLTSLVLRENPLENVTTYTEKNGNKVTEKTCAIIARLPNLNYVDLSGSNNITDFSALIDAGFTETGANTKIFTKS